MKITGIALVLVMGSMSSIGYGAEPSETLTVKDSEHPQSLVNADAKTRLQMTVITPQVTIESGKEYEIKVEIHNPDAHIEIVYMPGLTLMPIYSSDKRVLLPDEYGLPMVFGRMSAKDERLNFVVLAGGDSYVRTYGWTAPADGQVTFHAVYLNKKNGAEIGVKAWTGELRSQSNLITIAGQKKNGKSTPANTPYELGQSEARASLGQGKLCWKMYGQPMAHNNLFKKVLREDYNVELLIVAGCDVTEELEQNVKGYNEVMANAIVERFKKDVIPLAEAKAKQLFEDQRKK